jgi:hypothetical protein
MAKYRVLSLISFEFIVELDCMVLDTNTPSGIKIIKRYCEISDLGRRNLIPGKMLNPLASTPKVAEFMSRKKAEKWLQNYCATKSLDPVLFELVKQNG